MKALAKQSPETEDRYEEGTLADNLDLVFEGELEFLHTHKLALIPNNNVFYLEERFYKYKIF